MSDGVKYDGYDEPDGIKCDGYGIISKSGGFYIVTLLSLISFLAYIMKALKNLLTKDRFFIALSEIK